MAYNRKNQLSKIVDIQNITLEYKKKGTTQAWIFENLIKERFFISMATYNNYLSVNAKKEITNLRREKKETNYNKINLMKGRKVQKRAFYLKLKKTRLFEVKIKAFKQHVTENTVKQGLNLI